MCWKLEQFYGFSFLKFEEDVNLPKSIFLLTKQNCYHSPMQHYRDFFNGQVHMSIYGKNKDQVIFLF